MSTRDQVAAIVLAGGASSRFGTDKMSALIDGRPLLHHALAAADEVAATVVVVLGPGSEAPTFPAIRARLIVANDPETHQGPLAGLAAGLTALAAALPDVDLAILVGGDMPSLVPAVLAQLLDALAADRTLGVARLAVEPIAPLPLAVRPSLVAPASASILAEGQRALRRLFDRVSVTLVAEDAWRALDPDAETLRDVDTHRDLPAR